MTVKSNDMIKFQGVFTKQLKGVQKDLNDFIEEWESCDFTGENASPDKFMSMFFEQICWVNATAVWHNVLQRTLDILEQDEHQTLGDIDLQDLFMHEAVTLKNEQMKKMDVDIYSSPGTIKREKERSARRKQ